jgi:hypothetical protein
LIPLSNTFSASPLTQNVIDLNAAIIVVMENCGGMDIIYASRIEALMAMGLSTQCLFLALSAPTLIAAGLALACRSAFLPDAGISGQFSRRFYWACSVDSH